MKRPLPTAAAALLISAAADAEGWPRWLGPRGDSTWNDAGLITKFAPEGPKIVWRSPVANGYSGPSVAVILADLSPAGYKEASRTKILEPLTPATGRNVVWSHPGFANRCVFVRNDRELVCVSLAEPCNLAPP